MISVLGGIAIAGFLVVTAASQLPGRVGDLVRRMDPLGVVPAWTFFAPNPGVTDQVILVRDHLCTGEWTPWRVAWADRARRFRWLWRPTKRIAKLVSDCSSSLPRTAEYDDSVLLSVPFLILGNLAEQSYRHDFRADNWQFAVIDVAKRFEPDGPRLLSWFRSPALALGDS